MEELFSTEWDIILVGTGMVESILAGALAKAGKKVIHVDNCNWYGAEDATLNFKEFSDFMANDDPIFYNKQLEIKEEMDDKTFRQYAIDLQPKIIYNIGNVVDLILKSGVAKYMEFKSVKTGVIWNGNEFMPVPCNKSEIFQSKTIAMKDKRLLMRFIEVCSKLEDEVPDLSFTAFATEQGLPQNLQDIILYGILLVETPDQLELKAALELLKTYMASLGIYKDNSSVLYPLYGTSDLCQGFCRTAAVYETIYVLREEFEIKIQETGVSIGEGDLHGTNVYLAPKFHELLNGEVTGEIIRGVIASTKVLWPHYDGPTMLALPPGSLGNDTPTYIYQVPSQTVYAPKEITLYYISAPQMSVLDQAMEILFDGDYVFRASYTQRIVSSANVDGKTVLRSHGTNYFLEDCIEYAQNLFSSVVEGGKFYPDLEAEEDETEAAILDSID